VLRPARGRRMFSVSRVRHDLRPGARLGEVTPAQPLAGLVNAAAVVECEWCHLRATWVVTGQWTIFDWLDVYACGEHLNQAHRWLSLRTVDGQECLERTSHYIGSVQRSPVG